MPVALGADAPRREGIATASEGIAENDGAVLVAALEEIEAQRAAIAWLLEGNLLRHCLV